MSETKTFNCPSCGAALTTTGEDAEIKCQFCGNTVIVPPELRRPRDPDDDDGEDGPALNLSDVAFPGMKPLMAFVTGIVGVSVIAPLAITVVTLALVGVVMCVVFGVVVPMATSSIRTIDTFPTATRTVLAVVASAAARTPTPAGRPAVTATTFSKIVFQDTFSDPASGWGAGTFEQNTAGYAPGGYHILLGKDSGSEPVYIKDGFGDLSISVDAKQTAGPLDSWMGVLCRARKDVGAYGFEVSATGKYEIVKYRYSAQGSRGSPLERGDLSVPPKNDGANQLRADCIGSALTLWLNGRAVTTFKDNDFTTGGFGLIAETGASGKGGGDVLFSNYVVKGP
jgi:DNA-directed RNA polymerase subunit RPC12/RpoP